MNRTRLFPWWTGFTMLAALIMGPNCDFPIADPPENRICDGLEHFTIGCIDSRNVETTPRPPRL